jgi:predicted phosphodiesterase
LSPSGWSAIVAKPVSGSGLVPPVDFLEFVKLHIVSDVHLSLEPLALPATNADAVIAAGDIARPEKAVAWLTALAKPVLYVPGNHEFYGGSIAGTRAELNRCCAGTNVRLLDNDEVLLNGVRFLGTTLWSDFMLFGKGEMRAHAIREAVAFMNDFRLIRYGASPERVFTPADAATLFGVNARWLHGKLAEPYDGPTVVITHHAPSPKSIHPRFADSLINPCFTSDAERLVKGSRARLWVHGHMHDSFDYVLGETRVVCNPRGYARGGVNENASFNPSLVIAVE